MLRPSLISFHVAPASSELNRPPFLVLDERVDAVRVGAGDGDADLADHAGRQAWRARDLSPRLAAVGRLVEAAAGTAARHLVLDAIRLPQRRVHHVRIPPIDADVDRAGLVVAEQLPLPRLAAVDALEEAALVARSAVACRSRRRRRCPGSSDECGSSRSRRSCRSRRASTSSPRRSTCRRRRRE